MTERRYLSEEQDNESGLGGVRNLVGIRSRDLRTFDDSWSGGEINRLVGDLAGQGMLTVDKQCPEQHGGGVSGWQDGLGFDASLELLVEALNRVGCPRALPLACRFHLADTRSDYSEYHVSYGAALVLREPNRLSIASGPDPPSTSAARHARYRRSVS
jgi:hypothetical protein